MFLIQENRLAEDETRMVISESDSQEEHSEENQDLGLIKITFFMKIYGLCHIESKVDGPLRLNFIMTKNGWSFYMNHKSNKTV